jgi:alpha-methylacyl-CoA racemase
VAEPLLQGLRVVEFASVGGVPFCALLLAQMGAQVCQIRNPNMPELGVPVAPEADMGRWSRHIVKLDLKTPQGHAAAMALVAQADALIEGFRPGVMEKLGLGPDACRAASPGLVYGRLTGWGQTGPWASKAGHDINFIAMSGALHAMGTRQGPPVPPINLVGDLAGGALYLALAITAALLRRTRSGEGCVIDAAMTDGAAHLLSGVYGRLAAGAWNDHPASNVIDGGVPWYQCYRCADGGWMAVGAIETRFYLIFVQALDLDPAALPDRTDPGNWPALQELFGRCFASRPRAHWEHVFESLDACVTPVLSLSEATRHPLHAARQAFGSPDAAMALPAWSWPA